MSPTADQTTLKRFDDAQNWIRDADLLLFRRHSLISIVGRGIHSHAAMAGWFDEDLFCLEMREFRGGRAVPLRSQVERYPGRIDVYYANAQDRWPEFDRSESLRTMRRFTGCDYGYGGVFSASLLRLPVTRLFARAVVDDTAQSNWPPFCSDAIARADRQGGRVDVVNHLADWQVEPADLARSLFYEYGFTLIIQ